MPTPHKKTDEQRKQMRKNYAAMSSAKIGEILPCPGCGEPILKNHGQKRFCKKKCGDFYWKQVAHIKDKDPFPPPTYQSAFIGYR